MHSLQKNIENKSRTKPTVAQKDIRKVVFMNKISSEYNLQVKKVRDCGAQNVLGPFFCCETVKKMSTQFEEKTKEFCEKSERLNFSSRLQLIDPIVALKGVCGQFLCPLLL